jgi:hypothetical protein
VDTAGIIIYIFNTKLHEMISIPLPLLPLNSNRLDLAFLLFYQISGFSFPNPSPNHVKGLFLPLPISSLCFGAGVCALGSHHRAPLARPPLGNRTGGEEASTILRATSSSLSSPSMRDALVGTTMALEDMVEPRRPASPCRMVVMSVAA